MLGGVMLEDDIGLSQCHRGVAGEILEDELADVVGVADLNMNNEVLCSAEDEQLGDLGLFAQLLSHLTHQVPGAGTDADTDQCLEGVAQCLGVELYGESGDDPACLQ